MNDKKYEIKPIFIFGVPRCGSTLLEKIIASGKKSIPMGEETSVLENFFTKKVLEKQRKIFRVQDTKDLKLEELTWVKNRVIAEFFEKLPNFLQKIHHLFKSQNTIKTRS